MMSIIFCWCLKCSWVYRNLWNPNTFPAGLLRIIERTGTQIFFCRDENRSTCKGFFTYACIGFDTRGFSGCSHNFFKDHLFVDMIVPPLFCIFIFTIIYSTTKTLVIQFSISLKVPIAPSNPKLLETS